jgi:hypothetical protein
VAKTARKLRTKLTPTTVTPLVSTPTSLVAEPSSEATVQPQVKLRLYHLNVAVVLGDKTEVRNYWVEAPTQCSASKYTAMRPEVKQILLVELWSASLPDGATITFSTTKECP